MGFAENHNIGAFLKSPYTSAPTALTAAGAGDNTEIVGAIIDRNTLKYPLSVHIAIQCRAVLAASKKLTIKTVKLEHGDDSGLSDAANLATPADVDVLVDSGSGSTLTGSFEADVDLAGCKRYVRLKYTPDLNASGTDTATVAGQLIFGGQDTI